MDNTKIHDSQLSNLEKPSLICSLLDSKLEKASVSTLDRSHVIEHKNRQKRVMPEFSFKITDYTIGQNVEYEVQLIEEFKVFRKTIKEIYKFKTRYSKLEALNNKIKGKGFPPKKLFGNKNKQFVQKRKKELEIYLNGLTIQKSPEFLNFVLQIKQLSTAVSMKKPFKLPV